MMAIRQYRINQDKHVEVREAFILLYIKGYRPEAERLYKRLLHETPKLSNKQLLEDFYRTLMLVDPTSQQTNNLIFNYHWYLSHQLEERSEDTLERAKKLADEK
jgi:hypothetical protein